MAAMAATEAVTEVTAMVNTETMVTKKTAKPQRILTLTVIPLKKTKDFGRNK